MQKLDLRQNLDSLIRILKSRELVTNLTAQSPLLGNELMRLVIESKAGYDKAYSIELNRQILEQFNATDYYLTDFFTKMMTYLSPQINQNQPPSNYLAFTQVNQFFSFHNSLIITFLIVDKLLINNQDLLNEDNQIDYESAENKGNITFQIVDDHNIGLHRLKSALEAIDQLIDTVYQMLEKIEDERTDQKPEITVIDSGSDVGITIKVPKKAANIIAQIIKEGWDIIFNNKNYRHEQRVKAIGEALTQIKKIEEARKNGKIDGVSAERLKRGLMDSTERIIATNTVTKKLLNEKTEFSKRRLLMEANKTFLLEEHNEEDQDSGVQQK